MTVATNHGHAIGAGSYATSRRGGVSAHDVEQARSAIGRRATASMIARYLGRCEADIQAILNPPPVQAIDPRAVALAAERERERRRSEEAQRVDAEFAAAWNAGVPIRELRERFRLSEDGVKARRVRLGLDPRYVGRQVKKPWTPERDAILYQNYIVRRLSGDAVAKMLGISRCGVIGRAHRLGYKRVDPPVRRAA